MTSLGAIIFINNEISSQEKLTLQNQLVITEIISSEELDLRINKNPNYPQIIRSSGIKLLVTIPTNDLNTKNIADLVLFLKQDLIYVVSNKSGGSGQAFKLSNINVNTLMSSSVNLGFFTTNATGGARIT